MAIKRKKVAKKKTKKKKTKPVKVSKKKTKTKKKVATKRSATKKPSKVSKKKNKIKNKKNREVKKMSTETVKGGVSASLDTSHLKVPFPFKSKYGNYIGGKFVEPKSGKYFDNVSPINNEVICQMARSDAKDVDAALDAAHEAFKEWGKTDITTRSNIMNKIADVLEKNLNLLADS
jgi:aldehyde dehydrogenase